MNKQEFTQQVMEAENSLYRVARTLSANESDCEDAVQQAILIAYDKLDNLRNEKFFKTWLTRILINECYKIRRKSGFVISFEDYTADIPSDVKIDIELRDAVFRLPIKLRSVIVLYYIEGYSVEETAYMLKLPQGTVKSRLHKARKLLKTMLDDEI